VKRAFKGHTEIWIIGYGNPRRGDDGAGPYMVKVLKKWIRNQKRIRFLSLTQLTPDLINDLQHAAFILFIDATVHKLKKGWQLTKVKPGIDPMPFLSHHISPSYLLGLFQMIYKRHPMTWLISIQGYDFGLEEEFYPETRQNMDKAVSFICRFVTKMINKKNAEDVLKDRRVPWEMEQIY